MRARVSRQLLIHDYKMKLTKFEIRILHNWKRDYKPAAATRKICEVEGGGVVSERVAQRLFQGFNTG